MQTVLMTGAASGIGRAAALRFAAAGWACVLVDKDAAALEDLRPQLHTAPGVEHRLLAVDLTQPADVSAMADQLPMLDALINNAGMSDTSGVPLVEQASEQFMRVLGLNLLAPAALVQACSARLRSGARIVNVASGAGLHAIPFRGTYSASKAGLIAQSQALAAARPDWCVTVLCPGFVRTELVDSLIATGRLKPEQALAKIPLGRMADPQEMADALMFLASEDAAFLGGQVFALDGGSSVYGGSMRFSPTQHTPVSVQVMTDWRVNGDPDGHWAVLASNNAAADGGAYAASLDVSVLSAANLLTGIHAAARRYTASCKSVASLTVLLPTPAPDASWERQGEAAAARMLIATLACELAPRAMRINALEVNASLLADSQARAALLPLIQYVGGPRAQYLTGQTLCLGGQTRVSYG